VRGIACRSNTCAVTASRSSGRGCGGRESSPTTSSRASSPRHRHQTLPVSRRGRIPERTRESRRTARRRRARFHATAADKHPGSSSTAHAHGMVGQQYHEFEVLLRRDSPGTPWGFRLQGGAECQAPLTIQRVSCHITIRTLFTLKKSWSVFVTFSVWSRSSKASQGQIK